MSRDHLFPRSWLIVVAIAGIASFVLANPAFGETWTFQTFAGQNIGGPGRQDGVGPAARFYNPSGVAVGSDGTVYVADTENATIRKITPAGVVTTLAGTAGQPGSVDGTGAAAQFNGPSAVAVGSDGSIYVADTFNKTIRKITSAGVVTTLAGTAGQPGSADGTGAAAQFSAMQGVAVGSDGTVYVADTENATIRKITPSGVVTTLAGTAGVYGSADGVGAAAQFDGPAGLAVAPDGTIYVADFWNSTIRKVTPAAVVTTLAGTAGQTGGADGMGATALFFNPSGVAVGSDGTVYVADTFNGTLRKITPTGDVTTRAGTARQFGSANGTGAAARFYAPFGVAVGSDGMVYVADTWNNTIRKITPADVVTTLSGTAGESGSADDTGAAARFSGPNGVAAGSDGTIYVADTYNYTIRKITPAGVVTTLAGTARQSGSADGTGAAARFYAPNGVAVGSDGTVYVSDTSNHTIRKITPGGVVTTLAGTAGQRGSTDGTGAAARFSSPSGVAVGSDGSVYVADTNNFTIRKIIPTGVVTTLAGAAGQVGTADGAGAAARFYRPNGLTAGSDGTLYVADTWNSTIRKITPAGVVTTLAGTARQLGSTDGTGAAARFDQPFGVAVGSDGTVFVADTHNNTFRKITPAGVVTTLAGAAGLVGNADGTGAAARFFNPAGVAIGAPGTLFVADSSNNAIKVGTSSDAGGCRTTGDANCIADASTSTAFLIQLAFQSVQSGGLYGKAGAIPLQSVGVFAGGLFWFFSPDNPELMIKVLNGCGVNGKYWVFSSAGTNLGMTLDVTSTKTGERKTWVNPDLTAAAPIVDTSAFSCTPSAAPLDTLAAVEQTAVWGQVSGSLSELIPAEPAGTLRQAEVPALMVQPPPCQGSSTTLCIDGGQPGDGRFRFGLTWQTAQSGGLSGTANALPLASIGVARGGLFWFFSQSNPEVLVKLLNGCSVNGKFWVFTSAGTNVGMNLTVMDTQTSLTKTYPNADQQTAVPVQDTAAFSCN